MVVEVEMLEELPPPKPGDGGEGLGREGVGRGFAEAG